MQEGPLLLVALIIIVLVVTAHQWTQDIIILLITNIETLMRHMFRIIFIIVLPLVQILSILIGLPIQKTWKSMTRGIMHMQRGMG